METRAITNLTEHLGKLCSLFGNGKFGILDNSLSLNAADAAKAARLLIVKVADCLKSIISLSAAYTVPEAYAWHAIEFRD